MKLWQICRNKRGDMEKLMAIKFMSIGLLLGMVLGALIFNCNGFAQWHDPAPQFYYEQEALNARERAEYELEMQRLRYQQQLRRANPC